MPAPLAARPSPRLTAWITWGALIFGVLAFSAVAAFVGPGLRRGMPSPLPDVVPLAALGLSILLLVASRLVPGALPAGTPPLTRNIVALAIGEAGALAGLVAWMLTGSGQALAAAGVGLAAMLACFPGDARWRLLGGETATGGAGATADRSGGPGFGAGGR
jgi:hypothetical protein